MTDTHPSIAELGARMAGGTPQAAAMGFRFVSVEPGVGSMAAPYRADLVGDPQTGVLAGGVITTLLDQCCGMAVSSTMMNRDGAWGIATLDLRIDYMRPAEPGREVIAVARCYKQTRSIAFVRAIAFEDTEEDPVATAQAAFAITTGQASR
jgi:uncharacterized protein (TIGR00369 family)